jgi:hypothetical protein
MTKSFTGTSYKLAPVETSFKDLNPYWREFVTRARWAWDGDKYRAKEVRGS